MVREGDILLFCDAGHMIVGEDKLEENVYLDGGDLDFKLSTVISDNTREEFDSALIRKDNYYCKIMNPQPLNWCEICDTVGYSLCYKKYMCANICLHT